MMIGVNVINPISCFHQFFSHFLLVSLQWRIGKWFGRCSFPLFFMKKQWKGKCLIFSGRLQNAYQRLLYQKYQSQKKSYICKFANYRSYMPYVLACIMPLYAFVHYVPTWLFILPMHVLVDLCILRAYVPDVSLLIYMPTQPQYFGFVTGFTGNDIYFKEMQMKQCLQEWTK